MIAKNETTQNENLLNWYVLHCHPNKETFLVDELLARNIGVYYPILKVKPVNPRSRKIRPYFPGYVFIQTILSQVGESTFRWLPHSHGLVSFGGNPASVPNDLISKIQEHLEHSNSQVMSQTFRPGERVQILSEMFEGYEALFDTHIAGTERVRVLLKMLNNRQVVLELNKNQIVKRKFPD